MLVNNPKFEISAVRENQYPKNGLPEVVLVGKSNVGKSSFVNTMINRKKLARTSSEPGKTRQLNFYNMDNIFYFVDLPGYSFANMPKEQMAKISNTIDSYLQSRKNIALVVMLVDIRHKPTKDDKLMYDYLINSGLNFVIVPTKADKIAVTKVPDYCTVIKDELNVPEEVDIIPISSTKKSNLDAIWQAISETLEEVH